MFILPLLFKNTPESSTWRDKDVTGMEIARIPEHDLITGGLRANRHISPFCNLEPAASAAARTMIPPYWTFQ